MAGEQHTRRTKRGGLTPIPPSFNCYHSNQHHHYHHHQICPDAVRVFSRPPAREHSCIMGGLLKTNGEQLQCVIIQVHVTKKNFIYTFSRYIHSVMDDLRNFSLCVFAEHS